MERNHIVLKNINENLNIPYNILNNSFSGGLSAEKEKMKKETIEQAIEKEITRCNCSTCPKNYKGTCDITEEKIGSGEEYCELKPMKKENMKYLIGITIGIIITILAVMLLQSGVVMN